MLSLPIDGIQVLTYAASLVWLAAWCLRRRRKDSSLPEDVFMDVFLDYVCPWTKDRVLICIHVLCFYFTVGGKKPSPLPDTHDSTRTSTETSGVVASECQRDIPDTAVPLLIPARTTHTRLYPEKHSFSYSYLLVAIPVGFEGTSGRLISVGPSKSRAWFHVEPRDYLLRSQHSLTLAGRLQEYLATKNVPTDKYAYACLVTAPRVFNYSFNPVSFWYLYSSDHDLRAMILEVNNTFDERRMYYLEREESKDKNTLTFTSVWPKDFHVSPFNSREGDYALTSNYFSPFHKDTSTKISNTIRLQADGGKTKLVASIASTGPAINLLKLSWWNQLHILVLWSWTGLRTFPRILKEARTLYFKHGLVVWFRPEVLSESIPRHATATEKALEAYFAEYLNHIVASSTVAMDLRYIPCAGLDLPAQEFKNASAQHSCSIATLTVTSPLFYSRFVQYTNTRDALMTESQCSDERNRTIEITNSKALDSLVESTNTAMKPDATGGLSFFRFLNAIRWGLVRKLRPSNPTHSFASHNSGQRNVGARSSLPPRKQQQKQLSDLDTFVRSESQLPMHQYVRMVSNIFLADRFAFGLSEVIAAAEWAFPMLLGWWARWQLYRLYNTRKSGIELGLSAVSLTNIIHILAFLKGL